MTGEKMLSPDETRVLIAMYAFEALGKGPLDRLVNRAVGMLSVLTGEVRLDGIPSKFFDELKFIQECLNKADIPNTQTKEKSEMYLSIPDEWLIEMGCEIKDDNILTHPKFPGFQVKMDD